MSAAFGPDDVVLTPAEASRMFGVSPKTVARWTRHGRLRSMRTIGGHHRYRLADVRAAIEGTCLSLR